MTIPPHVWQLMTAEQFERFCDDLAEALKSRMENGRLVWECDHTFRHARAWLEAEGLNVLEHVAVFAVCSVYCDCEILFNIEQWPPFDDTVMSHLTGESPT